MSSKATVSNLTQRKADELVASYVSRKALKHTVKASEILEWAGYRRTGANAKLIQHSLRQIADERGIETVGERRYVL